MSCTMLNHPQPGSAEPHKPVAEHTPSKSHRAPRPRWGARSSSPTPCRMRAWATLRGRTCPANPPRLLRSHLVAGHPVNEICRGCSRQTHDLLKLVNILKCLVKGFVKNRAKTISNRKQLHTKHLFCKPQGESHTGSVH